MKPMRNVHRAQVGRAHSISIPGYSSKTYNIDKFKECEKCGGSIRHPLGWGDKIDTVYVCTACGFQKPMSHVSFGFYMNIPNYVSLTETYASHKLFFSDGSTVEQRIGKHRVTYLESKSVAHQKWELWIKENTIEMVKLASIADTKNIGADPKLSYDRNPMEHFKKHIKEHQGQYLTFVSIKSNKPNRKQQKIGHAIDHGLKNCKSVIWIGGKKEMSRPEEVLFSASTRLNRSFLSFESYKDLFLQKSPPRNVSVKHFGFPVYITGPSIIEVQKDVDLWTQEILDIYVDRFMTDLNNSLPEEHKFKVIINTGNSGVDTSVIRWAVKNKIYVVVVNLSIIMYLNQQGFNRYDTVETARERLLYGKESDPFIILPVDII